MKKEVEFKVNSNINKIRNYDLEFSPALMAIDPNIESTQDIEVLPDDPFFITVTSKEEDVKIVTSLPFELEVEYDLADLTGYTIATVCNTVGKLQNVRDNIESEQDDPHAYCNSNEIIIAN